MAHVGAPTAQAAQGGPRTPAPPPPQPPSQQYVPPPQLGQQQHGHGHNERSEQKRNLATWWNNFKRGDKKAQEQQLASQGIFGVPLQESIRYANVAISLFNDDGQSYIYGYVPIVVAKCGVYLKEKATDVEGIFRLAGSEKRIKELKVLFDSPDRYGKGLDWTGYTVHDAANILRRYFNQLPEPIIPLEFYDRFREPLRNHQAQAVGELEAQSPSVGHFDHDSVIRQYQSLITELPPLNRQLLLYILDLLAVFASKSDLNKMTTPNLSSIFQPGILNHPQHAMAPAEYRLSQDVLIFLIENQDSFLIGMQGTAADPETVREVQSGSPSRNPATPTTPSRSKTIVGRSASNASAGAESVNKFGSIRRNVSLSSRRSKRSDGGPTIVAGVITEPVTPGSGGVHRSNTVPSRRGANSPRFLREKGSAPSTPSPGDASFVGVDPAKQRHESLQSTPVGTLAPPFPAAPGVISASSSETTTLAGRVGSDASAATYQTPKKDTTPLLSPLGGSGDRKTERSASGTPSTTGGKLLDIFKQSPGSDGEGRRPNKLQKRRIPGSALSSAQSSNQSLSHDGHAEGMPRSPNNPQFAPAAAILAGDESGEKSVYTSAQATPTGTAETSLHAPAQETPTRVSQDNTLRPTPSPPHSFHSTAESDADMVGDDMPKDQVQQSEKPKRRHRSWFSRSQNKLESTPQASPGNPLGTMTAQDQTTSRSTVGSTGAPSQSYQPRRSFQEPTPGLAPAPTDPAAYPSSPPLAPQMQASTTDPGMFSDSEKERKNPISWLRGKFKDGGRERERERAEKEEMERRAQTPERAPGGRGSRQDLSVPQQQPGQEGRARSFDQPRGPPGVPVVQQQGYLQQQQQQQLQQPSAQQYAYRGPSPGAAAAAQSALASVPGVQHSGAPAANPAALAAQSALASPTATSTPQPAPVSVPQAPAETTESRTEAENTANVANTGTPTAPTGGPVAEAEEMPKKEDEGAVAE